MVKSALERYGYLEEVQDPTLFMDNNMRLYPEGSFLVELMIHLEVLQLKTTKDLEELLFRMFILFGSNEMLDDFFLDGVLFEYRYFNTSDVLKKDFEIKGGWQTCRSCGVKYSLTVDFLKSIIGFQAKRRVGLNRLDFMKKVGHFKLCGEWAVFYGIQDFRFYTSEHNPRRDFLGHRGRWIVPEDHVKAAEQFSEIVIQEFK